MSFKISRELVHGLARRISMSEAPLVQGSVLVVEGVMPTWGQDGEENGVNLILVNPAMRGGVEIIVSLESLLFNHNCPQLWEGMRNTLSDGEYTLPTLFEVRHVEDRMTRDGEKIYPVHAYNNFEDIIHSEDAFNKVRMYEMLMASGLKPNHGCKPKVTVTMNAVWH